MDAIQKLDQAEAITSARELVRAAFQLYLAAMNMLADAQLPNPEETLANSSGIIAADATILGLHLRELELEAKLETTSPGRVRGALPAGAGGVRCLDCGAEAAADGKGSPIVLQHDPQCPQRREARVTTPAATDDAGV